MPFPLNQALDQAIGLHRQGRLAEAEQLYRQILQFDSRQARARHMLGVIRLQQGRAGEALEWIGGALQIDPQAVEAHHHHAAALQLLGRPGDALASLERGLTLMPGSADLWSSRGDLLCSLGRAGEAVENYEKALALDQHHVDALNNRGAALRALGRFAEALASFEAALSVRPDYAFAANNRGTALRDLGRLDEALASYERALALQPDYAEALNNRGAVLLDLRRFAEALGSFDAALRLQPDNGEAHFNRGIVLRDMGRLPEALQSLDAATRTYPNQAEALFQRGLTLQLLDRPDAALASFEKALSLDPAHRYALGGIAAAALHLCDWTRMDALAGTLKAGIETGGASVLPLTMLGYSDDPALQYQAARSAMADKFAGAAPALWTGTRYRHDKIRLAYLSADFRTHPVAAQTAELFERHDRGRFEVMGISIGPDDASPMRARLAKAFDRFADVQTESDAAVAALLRRLEADIVVDLNGPTYGFRPEILKRRPAPVAVSYLGYPGTMGADHIDYILADAGILPFDRQPFFSEKIVHLPDSFWVSDSTRALGLTPTRAEEGLPEDGIVFCSFNNSWKITRPVFEVWMRLLAAVPGSVLWLKDAGEAVKANLRTEASAGGIAAGRLIFAGRAELERHLARHRLADLFLDTLPYNAHATASDALWAGLPLVTCRGQAFAGRVAASLLGAIGLPELVTENLPDYEALALKLARDGALRQSLRDKLERNRRTHSLFDTDKFCLGMEAAYSRMWELAERGEGPKSFSV